MFDLEKTPFHMREAATILEVEEAEINGTYGHRAISKSVICHNRPRGGFNFSNFFDILSVALSSLQFEEGHNHLDIEDEILCFIDKLAYNLDQFTRLKVVSDCEVIGNIARFMPTEPLCETMRAYADAGWYYLKLPKASCDPAQREHVYGCVVAYLIQKALPVFLADDFGTRDPRNVTLITSRVAMIGTDVFPYYDLNDL
jgi:hypothetical protein